jgi:hypothetical protein
LSGRCFLQDLLQYLSDTMWYRFFIVLTAILFCREESAAQVFGGNPASLRWKQINTDTVRVIFPEVAAVRAQRVAAIVHQLQRQHTNGMGEAHHKISIVLQNQPFTSNGYVGLGPWRSEFYLTAPQQPFSLGAVQWTDNLALHEFRHVQQYNHFNRGLSGLSGVLFGQEGRSVANAAAVPDWFFEGDAMLNETRYSPQGRGTLPLFFAAYKALWQEGKRYSYAKLRNGSYRDFVPDHYALGYLLTGYGTEKYGAGFWPGVTAEAASFRPLLYPFQGAIRRKTGLAFAHFVDTAFAYFRQQWVKERTPDPEWITPAGKTVTSYRFPVALNNGDWLVLKSGYRQLPAFYTIHPDGSEDKICVRAIADDDYFSYRNGTVVYAAYHPDARWGYRELHDIRILDIASGKKRVWFSGTKFQSPDISADVKKLIVVEALPDADNRILVLNEQGEKLDSLRKPGIIFSQPRFAKDDQHFYVTERNELGEMSLHKYSIGTNKEEKVLLPATNTTIGYVQVRGDTLLFNTTHQGKDEAWAVIDRGAVYRIYRLAAADGGVYQPALAPDGKIIGSVFTASGYRLAAFRPMWQEMNNTTALRPLYLTGVYAEGDHRFLAQITPAGYPVSTYRKASGLLNFHSWRPYYDQPEFSFTVYGQNVLNTFQSELSYTFNQNESSHKLGYNGVYGGTYLQPVFGASQTWQRSATIGRDSIARWNETLGYAGLQLPLNFTNGRWYRFLTLSGTYNLNQVQYSGLAQKLFANRTVQYYQLRLNYTSQIQQTRQQIYPHFAESISFQYRNAFSGRSAQQWLVSGALYLPGLAANHSVVFTGAVQGRDTLLQYLFSNGFPFSRGYTAVDFPRMLKWGVNYHLPLLYPEWGIAQMMYLLRVRANLFFDYTQGKSLRTGLQYPFRTVGMEIWFDTRWWNQQPVSLGFRYSRLLDKEFFGVTRPNVWEILLPVNLFR